jgi:triacylglycerol esterase/lipase EstA (alpha/beta hydrolase family)
MQKADFDTSESVEANSEALKGILEEQANQSGKKLILLAHSKGGVDVATTLIKYPYLQSDIVAKLVTIQSPLGGSVLAVRHVWCRTFKFVRY